MIALVGQAAPPGGSSLPRLVLPHVEYHLLIPQFALVGSAIVLLGLTSLTRGPWRRGIYAGWTIVTGLFAIGWSWYLWGSIAATPKPGPVDPNTGLPTPGTTHAVAAVAHAVAVDGFSLFFAVLIGAALVLAALVAESYLPREGLDGPEFYVLAMLCASGAMIMASANDLIVVFLGLEILSISLYVLAGYHSRRLRSGEAAMKYFILGAFSSAFFLYGVALVYGATGSTNLASIADFLATTHLASNGVLLAGLGLLLVGLGFKVAAVPFHVWTPDVYQGAPTPVTGFMAAVAKAAGFAALFRVFLSALPTQNVNWQPIIWVLAAVTMVVGAVLAVVQTNVKRMLAYSSINHAGFILVGLVAAAQQGGGPPGTTPAGMAGGLYYLMAYAFMVTGSFAVVTVVGGRGDGHHDLSAYRGLSRREPLLALGFVILLLAQAGVPFTAGFFAKFYVISAIVAVGTTWSYVLGIIAMLASVIAAFFYLRIVLTAYAAETTEEDEAGQPVPTASVDGDGGGGGGVAVATRTTPTTTVTVPTSIRVAVGLCVAFTIAFGVAPAPLIHFATKATLLF